ncbi:hypothetical protein EON65_46340 [archaeon]|nr:MAG: hypothetical protein EON65_46340 [archaeon]
MAKMERCVDIKEALRDVVRYCFDVLTNENNSDIMSVTINIQEGILHHKFHIRLSKRIVELESTMELSKKKYAIFTKELQDSIHAKSIFCSWLLGKLRKIFHENDIVAPYKLFLEKYTLVRDEIGVFPLHDTVPIYEHTYTWELTELQRQDVRDYDKFNILFLFLDRRIGSRLKNFFARTEQLSTCSVQQFIRW